PSATRGARGTVPIATRRSPREALTPVPVRWLRSLREGSPAPEQPGCPASPRLAPEHRAQPLDRVVDLGLADDQRREQADRRRSRRVADEALLQQRAADEARGVAVDVE